MPILKKPSVEAAVEALLHENYSFSRMIKHLSERNIKISRQFISNVENSKG